VADDDPATVFSHPTATAAWTSIIKEANKIRNKTGSNSASGPDYIGYSHSTIVKLIQDLPNARKCANYVWQEFAVDAGAAAAKKRNGKGDQEEDLTEDGADDLNIDE